MSSIIQNFATISDQDRDLLTPIEYRTIVEMIRGILNSYQFKKLDGVLKEFYAHLNSRDPLYLESGFNFYDKVITDTYSVYTKMLANPLSLADFKSQIVPTLGFVELFRRIVLNRYLYDQVKSSDGSVTAGAHSVYLSPDWRLSEGYPNPVTLTFPNTLANETDFIKLGWNGNTSPVSTIFTADFLTFPKLNLPVVFAVTSDSISTVAPGNAMPMPLASNDFTVHLNYTGTPTAAGNILTFKNTTETIGIDIATDRTLTISRNGVKILGPSVVSVDGKAIVTIDRRGYISLQVSGVVTQVRITTPIVFRNDAPLTDLTINAPYRNPFTSDFGLRSVMVYQGFDNSIPVDEIVVPPGYALIIDANGSYLTDPDGAPLMDIDIDVDSDLLGGFTYLVDSDGALLVNAAGEFWIVPADTYYSIVDDDATLLLDDDGAFVIEPFEGQ